MLNVYLLRHGQTAWNADGNRYCGRTDLPLTLKGIQQAQRVYEQLRAISFEEVYASPLTRANHTARIASGRDNIVLDPRLIEVDFGNWEGKTKDHFMAEDPACWSQWNEDPAHARAGGTGESGSAVVSRVDNFFSEMLTKHRNSNILVVGHNGINRLYLAYKLGMQLKNYRRIVQENSSVTLFSLEDHGEIILRNLNSRGVFRNEEV